MCHGWKIKKYFIRTTIVLHFTNLVLAVNGVLLKDNTHEKEVYISDCIPLFHQVRDFIHILKSNICSVTVYTVYC